VNFPIVNQRAAMSVERALLRPGELVKVRVEVPAGVMIGGHVALTGQRDGQTAFREVTEVAGGVATFDLSLPPTLMGSVELVASPETGMPGPSGTLASQWIAVAEPRALTVSIAPDQPEYR